MILQAEAGHEDLLDQARALGLPVVWIHYGSKHAVIIEGEIFYRTNDFEAFYTYVTSFAIFQIQWNCMMVNGVKKLTGFPNRASLELLHRYVLKIVY